MKHREQVYMEFSTGFIADHRIYVHLLVNISFYTHIFKTRNNNNEMMLYSIHITYGSFNRIGRAFGFSISCLCQICYMCNVLMYICAFSCVRISVYFNYYSWSSLRLCLTCKACFNVYLCFSVQTVCICRKSSLFFTSTV